MNIIHKRFCKTSYALDGELYIGGLKVCDTTENLTTSLAPGTYNVLIHTCKHYRRKMPVVMVHEGETIDHLKTLCKHCPKLDFVCSNTTLPFYCPQLKIGNGVHKRDDGSILVGELACSSCIIHPAEHFNRLIDRLDKCQNRKEPITLTISETYS